MKEILIEKLPSGHSYSVLVGAHSQWAILRDFKGARVARIKIPRSMYALNNKHAHRHLRKLLVKRTICQLY